MSGQIRRGVRFGIVDIPAHYVKKAKHFAALRPESYSKHGVPLVWKYVVIALEEIIKKDMQRAKDLGITDAKSLKVYLKKIKLQAKQNYLEDVRATKYEKYKERKLRELKILDGPPNRLKKLGWKYVMDDGEAPSMSR